MTKPYRINIFGSVVINAESKEEAREIAENDVDNIINNIEFVFAEEGEV